ncbi:YktB family protein [Virgibacillus litoralis]|uniref:UPF0637 protein J2Z82_001692 n=1 Tax=Virgibacillus litoralis TaxID=578221 RepID=A0ABS4HCX3_9BACI|nr:DUF1054 domain-containing protein [Virgibacillus litoralis]MBP1948756.1 uncharacterized protein YktB (UPF0637 family) [Virgibacillus litoralis]
MGFKGFTEKDFKIFTIDGLDERMEAIRENIQPKFKALGEELTEPVSEMTGSEMHIHIAQHLRRTKNPPNDTWMAFCHNKRGYKKHPHFQIGLFDDHLFVWLAYIYELPGKQEMAKTFLNHMDDIKQTVPDDYVVSLDHTKKDATRFSEINLEKALTRFQNVKKAEFLIGRHFKPGDPVLKDGQAFLKEVEDTFNNLTPLYKISMD